MSTSETALPRTPTGIRWRSALRMLLAILKEFQRNPISMLAKQAAYSLLYAVPSILIVLISLTAFIDKETNAGTSRALLDFVDERAPAELRPLLRSLVDNAIARTSQRTATLTALISLGIAIWGGAGAVGAFIYACNRVYEIRDTRSWVVKTLLNVALMTVGGVLVVLAFVLFSFGRQLGAWIAEETGRDSILIGILTSGRSWSLILVAGSLLLLYILAPNVDQSVRWVVPGVLVGTLAIAIAFVGLNLLLEIMNFGSAYGAASSVLVLLWTLYLMSAIVIVGAVVNATVARRFDRRLRGYLANHPDQRLGVQATEG